MYNTNILIVNYLFSDHFEFTSLILNFIQSTIIGYYKYVCNILLLYNIDNKLCSNYLE